MLLREFFAADAINLELKGQSKDDILKELITLLKLDEKSEGMLFKMLKRRENLGSTGIGRGIAIPHCRSLVVSRLRVAFGRKKEGVDYKAIDEKPALFFFLIVAPPLEVSNQYLPVLGKIFSRNTIEAEQTDIVMTLTPHVVRRPELKLEDLRSFLVGGEGSPLIFEAPSLGVPPLRPPEAPRTEPKIEPIRPPSPPPASPPPN